MTNLPDLSFEVYVGTVLDLNELRSRFHLAWSNSEINWDCFETKDNWLEMRQNHAYHFPDKNENDWFYYRHIFAAYSKISAPNLEDLERQILFAETVEICFRSIDCLTQLVALFAEDD